MEKDNRIRTVDLSVKLHKGFQEARKKLIEKEKKKRLYRNLRER